MTAPAGPRVTIALTQRESFDHTSRSIESLYATTEVPFDLVYVAAASPPKVQLLIDAAARRFGFRVLRSEGYLTPNQARNLAVTAIETPFVVFVDNDVIFHDAWLERLLACADETGADLVGPLVCFDVPPFRRVHNAGGTSHIETSTSGRRYRLDHRFMGRRVAAVANHLVREPTEMIEFHCMLVRRTMLERVGPLDERLQTANEHSDFCMLVREAGGTLVFEPRAVVNYLQPLPFPFDRQSRSFYRRRWDPAASRATIAHFSTKWQLDPTDPMLTATLDWLNQRCDLPFRHARPDLVRSALRLLRRTLRARAKA